MRRKISETDGVGNTVSYAYDEEGRLLSMKDAKGNSYVYEYDALGRLKKETNRLGKTQRYTYAGNGKVIEKVDFNGGTTEYTYDKIGQLTDVSFADGSEKHFTYDASGNLSTAENNARSYQYTWDELNRLSKTIDNDLGQVITYGYDGEGRRTSLSWMSGKRTQKWTYGTAGELASVTDADGLVTKYTYNDALNEIKRSLPNGLVTETGYDPAGRVSVIKQKSSSGSIIAGEAYVYDESGKRIYTVDEDGRLEAYVYDEAGRLEKSLYSFGSGKAEAGFSEHLDAGLFPSYHGKGGDSTGTMRRYSLVLRFRRF